MRSVLAAVAVAALVASGCISTKAPDELLECDGGFHPVRLFLGPDFLLVDQVPDAGFAPGNSFAGAFLTDELDEWLSASIQQPLHLEGSVNLTLFVESTGTPAPIPQGDPGNGYQFFNQFGSDRTFQPGFATSNDDIAQAPGTRTRLRQEIVLPPGGFELESGDRVRLLLTSLALDGPGGSGHNILYGNPHASFLEFQARCADAVTWVAVDHNLHAISLPGNQGLFTGQVGPNPYNTVTVPLDLHAATQRLTIDLRQSAQDANPAKDDIDVELVNATGDALWSIGSPYSNEHGVLWKANLDWLRANGVAGVRVNSYSGVLYEGELEILQEGALPA